MAGGVVSEIWLRIGEGQETARNEVTGAIHDFFYTDKDGTPRIREGAAGFHRADERGEPILVQINSHGFRGPEPLATPTRRVVFVGDSIVFSGGLRLEDTFVRRTELLVNAGAGPSETPVEIFNLGMSDTGVAEYLRKIEHHALGLNPGTIVVGFYLNDMRPPQGFLGEDGSTPAEQFLKRSVVYELRTVRKLHEAYRFWKFTHSREIELRFRWVPRFLAAAWENDEVEWRLLVGEANYDWGGAWVEENWGSVDRALGEMADLCAKSGVQLLLVAFPAYPQAVVPETFRDFRKPQDRLQDIASRHDIPLYDLLPPLRRFGATELFADQCHLTALGSEVVATELAPWLTAQQKSGEKRRVGVRASGIRPDDR